MRRILSVLLTFILAATSCGSGGDADAARSDPSGATTSVPEAIVSTSSTQSVPSSTTTVSSVAPQVQSMEISTVENLPALPILNEWVFDQIVWNPIPVGNDTIVMATQGGIRILDVDGGGYSDLLLVEDNYRRIETFAMLPHGDRYVSVTGDDRGNGTMDHIIIVDLDEQTSTKLADGPGFALGPDPEHVIVGQNEWDLTSMTQGPPVEAPVDWLLPPAWPDGEFWTLTFDGGLHLLDGSTLEEITSYDLETPLLPLASQVSAAAPETVMVRASDIDWLLVDRSTGGITNVDTAALLDQFSSETSIDGGYPSIRTEYSSDDFETLVRIDTESASRWALATIDQGTGEITSLHAFSDGSFDYGWTSFERPWALRLGERLFVLDNGRRIVEVDVDRLGHVTEPWVDDGLSYLPVLTEEEKEVEEVILKLLAGDTSLIDDQDRAEGLSSNLTAFVDGVEWFPVDLRIDGDRAWSRVRGTGLIGLPFSFRRIDGEWMLDAEGMCLTLEALQLSCDPQSSDS